MGKFDPPCFLKRPQDTPQGEKLPFSNPRGSGQLFLWLKSSFAGAENFWTNKFGPGKFRREIYPVTRHFKHLCEQKSHIFSKMADPELLGFVV